MHLSGITAEDRPGAQIYRRRSNKNLLPFTLGMRFTKVELAKGFEPPTL
jgi:hypothetical protein